MKVKLNTNIYRVSRNDLENNNHTLTRVWEIRRDKMKHMTPCCSTSVDNNDQTGSCFSFDLKMRGRYHYFVLFSPTALFPADNVAKPAPSLTQQAFKNNLFQETRCSANTQRLKTQNKHLSSPTHALHPAPRNNASMAYSKNLRAFPHNQQF